VGTRDYKEMLDIDFMKKQISEYATTPHTWLERSQSSLFDASNINTS
jgi:hypothetical protein